MIRVVADANVLVSAALARDPRAPSVILLDAAIAGRIELITSPALLAEIASVLNLHEVADELRRRLTSIFLEGPDGRRPVNGDVARFHEDEHWRDLVTFNEYFHGDDGSGLGASHQTGWTALVAHLIVSRRGHLLPHDGTEPELATSA